MSDEQQIPTAGYKYNIAPYIYPGEITTYGAKTPLIKADGFI
jgi:hypothetical protein